ncbi:DUF4397 domain-containing protein [Hymenobacter metallilatus]|uniref:DUF4397 domain-containing protein n=1 Tax=Hymenobacter metallilatus TaxID=2493666 RepID=A0A428JIJ7_9BACT|nr:DUF4397 domain-containing protein [Hymenobacter metallilatus]RSK32464.1 DUF4397 domain-containing protein [Hymenobacter metallilatus]
MKQYLLLALSTAVLLSACSKDQEFPAPITPPAAPDQGQVRVVNNLALATGGSGPSSAIQLQLNGNAVGPAVLAGSAGPYQAVTVGEPFAQIMLPASSGSSWVQFNKLPIVKNQRYTLFTHTIGTSQSAKVVTEAPAVPTPVAGKAQVRVINLAAESTPVRIGEAQAPAPLYPEVTWGGVTGYQPVDARTYSLQVARTDGAQTTLFTQSVTLAAGKAYTLVLRGTTYSNAVAPEKLAFDLIADE